MACDGQRLGTIFDRVREYYNEGTSTGSGSGYLSSDDTDLLLWANQCTSEIAQAGYWRKSGTITLVVGTGEYSLITALSDVSRLHQVRLTSTGGKLECCSNWGDIVEYLADYPSGTPELYFVMGDTLKLAPAPSASDTLTVLYSYHPGELDCTTNYTPHIPEPFDDVYTWYILWAASMKNVKSVKAERREEYWQLFQQKLIALLNDNPRNEATPYR